MRQVVKDGGKRRGRGEPSLTSLARTRSMDVRFHATSLLFLWITSIWRFLAAISTNLFKKKKPGKLEPKKVMVNTRASHLGPGPEAPAAPVPALVGALTWPLEACTPLSGCRGCWYPPRLARRPPVVAGCAGWAGHSSRTPCHIPTCLSAPGRNFSSGT